VSKKVSAQVASTQAPVKASAAAALAKKEEEEETARQAQIAEAAGEAPEAVAEEQVAESGETVETAQTIATVAEEIDASADSLASALTDVPMMFAQAGAAAAGGGAAAGGISTAAIVAGVAVVGVAAAASSSSDSPAATPAGTPAGTPAPSVTGTSYILTTNIEVLTGTSNNDTFIGDASTVQVADQINGGLGTDTFKVYGGTTLPTLNGIEAVEIHHTAMVDINMSSAAFADVRSLLIKGAEASDKTVTIKEGDVLILQEMTAGGTNDQVSIAAASTVTSATVTLIDMSDDTGVIIDPLGTGITTLTINETGTVSVSYADILADTTGVNLSTLIVNSTGKGVDLLDVDDAKTINASGSTATVNLDTAINEVTITGGSGNDNISLDHAATVAFEGNVALGLGDDTLIITSLNEAADLVDNKVTLDGGAGTDKLIMISDLAIALSALSAANYTKKGISNFEQIVISDATANNDAINFVRLGVTSIDFAAKLVDSNTFTVSSGTTIELSAAADDVADTATITVDGAADAGRNADVVTLRYNAAHAAPNTSIDYGKQSIASVETINIISNTATTNVVHTTAKNVVDIVATSARTINVTGNFNLDLSGDPFENVVETFNASAFTGTLSVSFAGGAGVTATGSATKANTIVGSSNADLITGGSGADVITAGDGIDTINLGAADGKIDTVNLNEILLAANRDTINHFETARDLIEIGADETTAATAAGAAATIQVVSAVAASHTNTDTDILEFAFTSATSLAGVLDGTALLTGISNSTSAATLNVHTDQDSLYIIAYSGGDAFLYYADETNDADVILAAADIRLVAHITGVAVGELSASNFTLVA
jgi:hypothetical protein